MGCGCCKECSFSKIERHTTIIPEFPGYVVCRYPDGTMKTEWEPVKNVYSPPVLHRNMHCETLSISPEDLPWIAFVIGKDGRHLKLLSTRYSIDYIFFRNGRIEMWGDSPVRIGIAQNELMGHISRVVRKHAPRTPLRGREEIRNRENE